MVFETLKKMAVYSFEKFCSVPRRLNALLEPPNDPAAIKKAEKLAKFTALWYNDEETGAWYFNSVSTLGNLAYSDTVTKDRVELWEKARSNGIFQRGPQTRGQSNLATTLTVRASVHISIAVDCADWFTQDFDYYILGLHKAMIKDGKGLCSCLSFWHCGYCSHLIFLLFPTAVSQMTASADKIRRGAKRDARTALVYQDSPTLNKFPKPSPGSAARKKPKPGSKKKLKL